MASAFDEGWDLEVDFSPPFWHTPGAWAVEDSRLPSPIFKMGWQSGEELTVLVEQGETAQAAIAAAKTETEAANIEARALRIRVARLEARLEMKSALEETLDAALDRRLSALPHYNRYTRTETKTVSAEDPLYKKLVQSFVGSVTQHRGPKRGDPSLSLNFRSASHDASHCAACWSTTN